MESSGDEHASSSTSATKKHVGSCHCGAVRFEVDIDVGKGASRCNCRKPDAFALVAGKESVGEYVWGASVSSRFFCKHCGTYCYGSGHLAQLGGDFVSVNFNCLDDIDLTQIKIIYWDGRNNNWAAGPRDEPWPLSAPASR